MNIRANLCAGNNYLQVMKHLGVGQSAQCHKDIPGYYQRLKCFSATIIVLTYDEWQTQTPR